MRGTILMAGAASLALIASPALAGGNIGSSGNMGGLLGGGGGNWGGHQSGGGHNMGGGQKGGHGKGGGWEYSKGYKASHEESSKKNFSEKTFKQNDTTLGGIALNPQIAVTKTFSTTEITQNGDCGCGGPSKGGHDKGGKGGGHASGGNGGGSASNATGAFGLAAGFPVVIQPTTLGGFEATKTNYSSEHNSRSSASGYSNGRGGGH